MNGKNKQQAEKLIKEKMLDVIVRHYGIHSDSGLLTYEIVDIPDSKKFMYLNTYLSDNGERILIHSGRKKFKEMYVKTIEEYSQTTKGLLDFLYNIDSNSLNLEHEMSNHSQRYDYNTVNKIRDYVSNKIKKRLSEINHTFDNYPKFANLVIEPRLMLSNVQDFGLIMPNDPNKSFLENKPTLFFNLIKKGDNRDYQTARSELFDLKYPDLFQSKSNFLKDIDTMLDRLENDTIEWIDIKSYGSFKNKTRAISMTDTKRRSIAFQKAFLELQNS